MDVISDNSPSMEVDSQASVQIIDLPEEVLISVFEFLDGKSLKSSRLVAKTWNEVR